MKPESKRGFPGGFFIFLLAAILIILTVQNLGGDKTAKVAFSHQLEHLVNLDLIQKEDSRKIALNDNLVTFSGKFKDKQSDDAKARFRYLDLLNRNHELSGQNPLGQRHFGPFYEHLAEQTRRLERPRVTAGKPACKRRKSRICHAAYDRKPAAYGRKPAAVRLVCCGGRAFATPRPRPPALN